MLEYENDFIRVATAYDLNYLKCVSDIKRLFFDFTRVLYKLVSNLYSVQIFLFHFLFVNFRAQLCK